VRNGPARSTGGLLGWGVRRAVLGLLLALAWLGTASCARQPAPAAPSPAVAAGPAFLFYYADGGGVHRLDARTGHDTLLIPGARQPIASALAPDTAVLAVGYAAADSARLVLIETGSGAIRPIHASPRGYRYTVAWAPEGSRLAAGFFTERQRGNLRLPAGGDIVVIGRADGRRHSLGCEASKMVHAWVAPDTLMVSDGLALYPVSVAGCRSDAAISLAGKRLVGVSPEGRLLYTTSIAVRQGGRTVQAAELYLAERDGSRPRRIIGYPYDPRRARFSGDGRRIAFDVRPPEAGSLRYIAVYDIAEGRVRFFPSDTPQGRPRDSDPVWVPGANNRLVHDRVLGSLAQKILRTLALDPTVIQTQPQVLLSGPPVGTTWGWADPSHLVVVSQEAIELVTTDGTTVYRMPGGRTLLAVVPAR
jgi:hypothetical protein